METPQTGAPALASQRYVIAVGNLIWNEFNAFRELDSIRCPKLFPMTTEGRIDADFERERAEIYFRQDRPGEAGRPEIRTMQFALI